MVEVLVFYKIIKCMHKTLFTIMKLNKDATKSVIMCFYIVVSI